MTQAIIDSARYARAHFRDFLKSKVKVSDLASCDALKIEKPEAAKIKSIYLQSKQLLIVLLLHHSDKTYIDRSVKCLRG